MFQGVRRNVREGGGNPAEQEGKMPIASLFVREVERRLDTAVFRSCFATSIYEARSFVVQGKVRLNGVRVSKVERGPEFYGARGDTISKPSNH